MAKNRFILLVLLFVLLAQIIVVVSQNPIINDRMLFGLLGSNIIALIVQLIIFVTILVFIFCCKYYKFPLILIVSGLLSNISDRIFFGGVRDYIKIGWWPDFNLADIFIITGLFLLVFNLARKKDLI